MATALIRPHPLSTREQRVYQMPEGCTLEQLALEVFPSRDVHPCVVIFIGDVRVPMHLWPSVRPKPGAMVRIALSYFEGGRGSKQVLAMVAMVAISVFAAWAAPALLAGTSLAGSTLATTALAAGITMAGSLAISALFKPPMLDQVGGSASAQPADSATYSISGQSNQMTPYSAVLRVYGRHRIFPRVAAVPYVRSEGPDQYLYMLLDCGYGPLVIEDIRIGDTALANFQEALWRVQERWHAGMPLDIYGSDVAYQTVSATLEPYVPTVRVTADDAGLIGLELLLPRGLVHFNDRGEREAHSVTFTIEISPIGSGVWIPAQNYPHYTSHELSTTMVSGTAVAYAENQRYVATGGDESGGASGYYESYFAAGTTSLLGVSDVPVVVGDVLYFASQSYHTITAILGVEGAYTRVAISPPLPTDLFGQVAHCPIIRNNGSIIITDSRAVPIPFGVLISSVPYGQYEVRVTRTSGPAPSDRYIDDLAWVALGSSAPWAPVAVQADHTLIELKIRASEQFQGVIQNINCIATSILHVWNGSSWHEEPTRNPAWAYADALGGSAAIRPLDPARIDTAALLHWAQYCDELVPNGVDDELEPRVQFDHVVDYSTTTAMLLQSIAAAGRATPAVRDGLYGVIVDEEQDVPVQMFTPRNSWGFNARRAYVTEPDALRVKFIDPENAWQEGQVSIYAAGKNETTALTFEDLKLFGVTRWTQATRDGRYLKAQALLRREEFEISCDIENLIAARGDLVVVQHDVLTVGGESTRVKSWDVATLTLVLVDPFGELPDEDYGVRLRFADGRISHPIPATAQAPDTFILHEVPDGLPQKDDLVAWGFLEIETGEYLVKQIAPGEELTARLTLIEIARDVYYADEGVIPPYVPPAGGRPLGGGMAGPGPAVRLRVEQVDVTIAREPYCDLVLTWQLGTYASYRVSRVDETGTIEVAQLGETQLRRFRVETQLRLLDPESTKPRSYAVVGIDANGTQSKPAFVTYAPVNPRWVPGDVTFLASNVQDKTTTLTWIAPNDAQHVRGNGEVMFYEVRWQVLGSTPSWAAASRVTDLVPWNTTTVTVPSRNGAYLVKAITSSGVASSNGAVTVTAVEDLVISDLWRSIRFEPDWAGQFDHVEVDAGDGLVLAVQPDGTYPARGVFYSTDREVFAEILQCRVSAYVNAEGFNASATMSDWIPLAAAVPLDSTVRGRDWNVTVWILAATSTTGSSLMASWTPLAAAVPLDTMPTLDEGDWRPLINAEYIGLSFAFALVLESFAPNVTPRVAIAGVDIDFPERSEAHEDVAVPASGLSFLFSRPFALPPTVAIDLQDADPGDYVQRGSATRDGISLFVRNASGTAIAGTVDISAFGVGRLLGSPAPNVPPSVTLAATGGPFTAPATVNLTATASDSDGTVTKVEFYRDSALIATVTTPPYTHSDSALALGSYSYTAKAYDDDAATTISTPVSVTVNAAANVPPTVSITAPANGSTATAPATINLAASASDSDGTITKVEFYRDGSLIATITTPPYTYADTSRPVGSYSYTAKAYDNAGAVTTSSAVSVTVNAAANVPPTVSITSPLGGASFTAPATINLSATASDPDGTIAKVEFYRDGGLIATVTTPTAGAYVYNDAARPIGSYSYTAWAYDNVGAITVSSAVAVTVAAAPAGQVIFDVPGAFNWTVPAGVTSVCVVCVGAGGNRFTSGGGQGCGGGGLGWKNNIAVTPGAVINGRVGSGLALVQSDADSWFVNNTTVCGRGASLTTTAGGTFVGDGGGNGGAGGGGSYPGGGGAGGYSGNGGTGASGTGAEYVGTDAASGSGGGGGGGGYYAGGGGGVGLKGLVTGAGARTSGKGGNGEGSTTTNSDGVVTGGSAGSNGQPGAQYTGTGGIAVQSTTGGGNYGGGGGNGDNPNATKHSSAGGVRIIWGAGRAYPATNTGDV